MSTVERQCSQEAAFLHAFNSYMDSMPIACIDRTKAAPLYPVIGL